MVADHATVPAAVPALPVDVVHLTAATPTLSVAVPLTRTEVAEVENTV